MPTLPACARSSRSPLTATPRLFSAARASMARREAHQGPRGTAASAHSHELFVKGYKSDQGDLELADCPFCQRVMLSFEMKVRDWAHSGC